MSAKLLKQLADGKCVVKSNSTGTVRVYWRGDSQLEHIDVPPYATIDLTEFASVKSLRRSHSLKTAVGKGWLRVQ